MSPNNYLSDNRLYLAAAEDLRANPGQWQLYESSRNCVVLAGPGTGKTKALTIKLARVLDEDVAPPQGVACITYNSECARELTRRSSQLGVHPSRRVFVGTVHGFCLSHIVRPYASIGAPDLPNPFRVATKSQRDSCLEEATDRVLGKNTPVYEIREAFELYRRMNWRRDATGRRMLRNR